MSKTAGQAECISNQSVTQVGADTTLGVQKVCDQNSPARLTGVAGTTVIKASPGHLHTINIFKATTTVKVYDGPEATGELFAEIDGEKGSFLFDVEFGTNLTIVTTGDTVEGTVSYR